MKHLLTVFFLTLSYSFTHAQENSKIVLRNGDTLVGIVKSRGFYGTSIMYRKTKKDDKVKYTYKEVKEIYLEEDDEINKYIYKIIKGITLDDKIRLLRVIVEGKASLFSHDPNTSYTDANGMQMQSIPTYYICLDNKSNVHYLSSGNPKRNKVKNKLIEVLSGCNELTTKINAKMFKYNELSTIVKYYNTNCASKN